MSIFTAPMHANVPRPIVAYPESDGQPMAENTLQFQWIVTIKEGLAFHYRDREDVFVAGDLLWYPVEGKNKLRTAPDVMVVFGRPKAHRGSYMQWEESGIAPQVAFEILSPGNRPGEMKRKLGFYRRHGVLEYYLYDPQSHELAGWLRDFANQAFSPIDEIAGWTSPRLEITLEWDAEEGLRLIRPDGRPFETYDEIAVRARDNELMAAAERRRADNAEVQAEAERQRAEAERQRAEAERQRAERLMARLRALGEDLDN